MESQNDYMQLIDTNEFNDAVYSGKIKLRPNYISCTPGVFAFISGTSTAINYNNSTTATFNLTLANKQYMLIDDAYLYVELETITSSAITTPATFIKPNILASMVQNITISTKDFTYTSTNFNKGRSLSVLSNIFRLRSYSCNQMRLASQRENMTFANINPSLDSIDLNSGICISNALTLNAANTNLVMLQLPLSCLLPNIDKIKFISGTVTINMNFNFDTSFITSGAPVVTTTTTPLAVPLAVCYNFTFKKIFLQYSTIVSTSEIDISNNSQKISALYIQRQLFNPLATDELTLTTSQNIGTMTSQPLVVSGKPLNIISIPQITSCTSTTASVGPVYAAPGTDLTIPAVIPTDNVTGNNADYILNSLFTISNFKVISSNGQVYPSNNPIIQYGSTWSDSYNFQNSFVQTMGFNPSGADSNSTLTFNQYKNYFKAVITDISNDTDDSYNNNCTYNVSFDLWNIADMSSNPTNAKYKYTFAGDIFMVSAKYVY